jgi:hypothetical protein
MRGSEIPIQEGAKGECFRQGGGKEIVVRQLKDDVLHCNRVARFSAADMHAALAGFTACVAYTRSFFAMK